MDAEVGRPAARLREQRPADFTALPYSPPTSGVRDLDQRSLPPALDTNAARGCGPRACAIESRPTFPTSPWTPTGWLAAAGPDDPRRAENEWRDRRDPVSRDIEHRLLGYLDSPNGETGRCWHRNPRPARRWRHLLTIGRSVRSHRLVAAQPSHAPCRRCGAGAPEAQRSLIEVPRRGAPRAKAGAGAGPGSDRGGPTEARRHAHGPCHPAAGRDGEAAGAWGAAGAAADGASPARSSASLRALRRRGHAARPQPPDA
jgi:hypothetical protein